MTYKESLDYLYARLPMFQRVGAAALKYDLTNTIKLLDALGNPHKEFKSVHIAGTNGKGTSAHALSSVLTAAGYKTGLFTSPHLKSFTERSRINGIAMEETIVVDFVVTYKDLIEQINPSFFEVTFAMSMKHFYESGVDIAIIETGLGGRLDSTNIIDPEVCLITSIGYDHADLLGDTLEKIAFEKAGIIKPNTPVIIGADQPELLSVFQNQALIKNAELLTANSYTVSHSRNSLNKVTVDVFKDGVLAYQNLDLDISAAYFLKNIPGVLSVIDQLKQMEFNIQETNIRDGLRNIKQLSGLKGRWQVLSKEPLVVADISHNLPGLVELFDQVNRLGIDKIHLIFGVVKDKALDQIIDLIKNVSAQYYFTQSSVPRSLGAEELKVMAQSSGMQGQSFINVNDAIKAAKIQADPKDLILICGSTFVVAEIDDL